MPCVAGTSGKERGTIERKSVPEGQDSSVERLRRSVEELISIIEAAQAQRCAQHAGAWPRQISKSF